MRNIPFTRGLRLLTAAVLALTLTLSLAACKPKEAVTLGTFNEKMSGLGYTTMDITADYSDLEYVTKCVGFESGSLHVEFLEIDGRDNAVSFFNVNRAQVESYKSGTTSESSVNVSSYQKYTLKTPEKYYVVERVGTTAIYAYATRDDADLLNDLLKEIGY